MSDPDLQVLCVHYIQLVYFVCHRFAAPAWGLLDYGNLVLRFAVAGPG